MKSVNVIIASFLAVVTLQSCQEKKVVEVEITEPVAEEVTLGNPADVKAEGKFQMPGLAYAYNALEPNIDGRTMEIHYSKHHVGYANNLNKAIAGMDLENKSIEELLKGLDLDNKAVRNNAGGYYNHNLFWEILSSEDTEPSGDLLDKINADFGSVDALTTQLKDA